MGAGRRGHRTAGAPGMAAVCRARSTITTRRDRRRTRPGRTGPGRMASFRLASPAPARPYSDSDADPRPINADSGAVPAVIAGIPAVIAGIAGIPVIAAVIAPPADQCTTGTRTIAADDRFGQIRLRERGANS